MHLAALNKKREGGLLTQDLTEVFINNKVNKDVLVDTGYLTTLIAIVPK
jgi:hypothetical protein